MNEEKIKKKSVWRYLGPLLGIVLLVLIVAYQAGVFVTGKVSPGRSGFSGQGMPPASRIFKVKEVDVPEYYTAVGTVHSRDEIEISPRITARIDDITRRSGDSVKKGEVLVKLDDSDLQAMLKREKEGIKEAVSAYKLSVSELKRTEGLFQKEIVSEKEYDRARETQQTAAARLLAANEAYKEAKANLDYATIKSPISGIVAERNKDPGDLAAPNNILLTIFDPERLMLYVPVRESLVKKIKVGDKMSFFAEALGKDFTGEVREIVPSVDPGSRTFLVKICIGESKKLMPGMFGVLKLKLGMKPAIIIPEKAVSHVGQLEYVTVLRDKNRDKLLVRTVPGPVPGKLRVISGLKPGMEITVNK